MPGESPICLEQVTPNDWSSIERYMVVGLAITLLFIANQETFLYLTTDKGGEGEGKTNLITEKAKRKAVLAFQEYMLESEHSEQSEMAIATMFKREVARAIIEEYGAIPEEAEIRAMVHMDAQQYTGNGEKYRNGHIMMFTVSAQLVMYDHQLPPVNEPTFDDEVRSLGWHAVVVHEDKIIIDDKQINPSDWCQLSATILNQAMLRALADISQDDKSSNSIDTNNPVLQFTISPDELLAAKEFSAEEDFRGTNTM